jgi:hypothetical protein
MDQTQIDQDMLNSLTGDPMNLSFAIEQLQVEGLRQMTQHKR